MARKTNQAMGDDPLACLGSQPEVSPADTVGSQAVLKVTPVKLTATANIAVAGTLKEILLAHNNGQVVIDGSSVESIDTSILQLLAALALKLKENGDSLEWSEPSPYLMKAAKDLNLETCLGLPT